MRITILGASGKVGCLVVAEALRRGHTVTAVVHRKNQLPESSSMTVMSGDIHDASFVADSVLGSQAVISALGSWGTKSKDIVASGVRHAIAAMESQHIARIVTLTGTEAYDAADKPTALRRLAHFAARCGAGRILLDGEEHIALLRSSSLDWTVLRAPVMTNGIAADYRLTLTPMPPWQTIPRKAVAKALVDQVEGAGYLQAAPFIYRR